MTRPVNGKGVRMGRATYYKDGIEQTRYCHTCLCPIKAGTPCYTKKVGGRNGSVKAFHKHCFDRAFLGLDTPEPKAERVDENSPFDLGNLRTGRKMQHERMMAKKYAKQAGEE